MANMLSWLTGQEEPQAKLPVRYEDGLPSLTAYRPAPSEQFSQWLAGLLGSGPGASLAGQRFATGVPELLKLSPLGIGLSAADLVHAKRADDPMGAAAAAIGMIPGAGSAGRKAAIGAKPSADQTMKWIEEALAPHLPPLNPAKKYYESEDATAAALKAIEEILGPAKAPAAANAPLKTAAGHALEPIDQTKPWLHPEDTVFQNGQWWQKAGTPNTKAAEAADHTNPFDYKQNKFGNYDIIHTGTGEVHGVEYTPQDAQNAVHAYHKMATGTKAPVAATPQLMPMNNIHEKNLAKMLADNGMPDAKINNIILGHNINKAEDVQTIFNKLKEQKGGVKPVFDYEKDDTGLYHVFDATTGKTAAVVDTPNEAKAWIGKQTGKPLDLDPEAAAPKNVPIGWGTPEPITAIPAKPPWMAPPLPEAEREAARLAGDYTTPAWRGLRIHSGQDFGPVFQGEHMFSSNNPQLAEMYAGSLHQHPDNYLKEKYVPQGSTIAPFWLNTKDYHVADAKGKMWSDFNSGAIAEAKSQGKKGVVIHNVWDEPHSTKNLGSPNTVYITFPEGLPTVKSKFAQQFDPTNSSVAKGLALTAGGGAAAASLSGGDAQAAPGGNLRNTIDTIMSTFAPMDSMRLPLQQYAARNF